MEKTAKNKLGRGINALLSSDIESISKDSSALKTAVKAHTGDIVNIPIDQLSANPFQPRTYFDEEKLKELSISLQNHGILEPLLVTENQDKNSKQPYLIIAGERRYRAAKIANFETVPTIVLSIKEEAQIEIALIENLQRENLNPIETAISFRDIMKLRKLTQDGLAKKLGISRPMISNLIRLLLLPKEMQHAVSTEQISQSHARLLLSIEDEVERTAMFKNIVENKLSVREVELLLSPKNQDNIVKKIEDISRGKQTKHATKDSSMNSYEEKLIEYFGTKVNIKGNIDKGSITIEYFNQDDLSRILDILRITL